MENEMDCYFTGLLWQRVKETACRKRDGRGTNVEITSLFLYRAGAAVCNL